LRQRIVRAAVVFAGSLAACAWVVVPLVLFDKWSAINQPLAGSGYVRGYGARQELAWLFTGQIFDARRSFASISLVVLVGAVVAVTRWRAAPTTRALFALGVASLLLSFGPTTWGPLADLVPAHADLYFRRFTMGTQLAGIYLAGAGAVFARDAWRWLMSNVGPRRYLRLVAAACCVAGTVAWFSPAGGEISSYDQHATSTIAAQRSADAKAGAMIAPLISYVKSHHDGRAYAGLPGNWGQRFTVGFVPVFKYLESQDVDEVTYLQPSLSLMVDPESHFDEDNPADYALFGVRYIFLPTGTGPPVPARRLMADGLYSLWQVGNNGYVELVQLTGSLSADRSDIGSRSAPLLETLGPGEDSSVQWPGVQADPTDAVPGYPAPGPPASLGTVETTRPDLADGTISTEVKMAQAWTLLLSVTYDPGWHVQVNGHAAATVMLAPALIGVDLPQGVYRVAFRYTGYQWYPELWAFGLAGLAAAFALGWRWHMLHETE
jgi:hypothetical protein